MWYEEIAPNVPISQGDIFFNCPIPTLDPSSIDVSNPFESEKPEVTIYKANIVIVTQACDLSTEENNEVVDNVVVVPLDDVATMKTTTNKWDFVSQVLVGRRPNAYLLNKYEGSINMGYQITDFSSVYTIPYELLMAFREKHGTRLRLNSPHRELLSQKFGNYFARIGLPFTDSIDRDELKSIAKQK